MAKNAGLEVEEDLKAQRRHWIFQKFGIGFMVLFTLASFLGLLAPGPFSKVDHGQGDDIKIKYERSVHYRDSTDIDIEISPTLIREGKIVLSLTRDFVSKVHVDKIIPEPEKVETDGEEFRYTFRASSSTRPLLARFQVEPEDRGWLEGEFKSETGAPVKISQFIFP
jgi:hypothetical protein